MGNTAEGAARTAPDRTSSDCGDSLKWL